MEISSKEHTKKTIDSIKWNLLVQVLSQASVFVVGILLMRLLSPKEFGLLGMITVITSFLTVFKDFGLGNSLIHKSEITESDINTVFWFSLGVGVLLTLLIITGSSYIAAFYDEPLLKSLAIAVSFLFIIDTLGILQTMLFKKTLQFKQIFIAGIISVIGSSIISIFMAYTGWGVWSLVALSLSKSFINTALIWWLSSYRPKFNFSIELLKEHWNYAYPLLGNQIFNYWTNNADRFFIGKYLGSEQLGFYSRANNLVLMPTKQLFGAIAPTLFPSFALIKDDIIRIRQLYLNAIKLSTFFAFPILGIFIVFAKPIVLVLFGEQWISLIPLLIIIPFSAALDAVYRSSGALFLSQGQVKALSLINIIEGVICILVFFIGSQFNITVIAVAYVIISFFYMLVKLHYSGRIINCSLGDVIKSIFPLLISTTLTVTAGFFIVIHLIGYLNIISLILGIIAYGLIWLGLIAIIDRKTLKLVLKALQQVKG